MAVFRGVSFLCAVLLCIVLCTDLHARRFPGTAARTGRETSPTVVLPNLPPRCTTSWGDSTLSCEGASFREILQTIKAIGNKLVFIIGQNCLPREPVSLNASCFENIVNLTSLTLSSCGVANIADGTFAGLGNLNSLYLDSNIISAVTTGMFSGLDHLETLRMRDNRISDLSSISFANMPSLRDLNFDDNRIGKIENGTFHGMSKLRSLSLNLNSIQDIDQNAFSGLDSLRDLDLHGNKIRLIQRGVFKPIKNLTRLGLSSNPDWRLKADHVFSDLHVLESLSMASNRDLLMGYNNRKPDLFAGLRNLKTIFLSGIDMAWIDYSDLSLVFKDQRETLKFFACSDCRINNRLLDMIKNLKHLDEMLLGNNELVNINHFSLPKITKNSTGQIPMHLYNNKITYIDERAFEGMNKNISVLLDRNVLDCSCEHAGFSRWLSSARGAVVQDRYKVFCGSPVNLAGTRVMDYDPYWWQCSEYMPLVALIFIVGFLLVVSLIILIVYCNRINFKHWLLLRQFASTPTDGEDTVQPTESGPLLNSAQCRNPLRQGEPGLYIIHESSMQDWVNKYLEDQLQNHPMKISFLLPKNPEDTPLWKQIKNSRQVHAFLSS